MKSTLEYITTRLPDVLPQLQSFNTTINSDAIYQPVSKCHEKIPFLRKVSAVIITFNEELVISETLSRLWWCDEIIIIDSGSTDKTVQICHAHGCNVYKQEFAGFGEQKKYGVSQAKNDWILCIDADELLSEPLIDEIQNELSKTECSFAAFEIPLTLVFMQKVFRYGKESKSHKIRLFNKTKGDWDGALVHETVSVTGKSKRLKNKILHYSYTSYSQFLKKIDLYSSLCAKKMVSNKHHKNKTVIAVSIPFNFIKYYLIDRNFLNGYQGFAWAVLNSIYHFVKYLKVEELKRDSQ